MATKLVVAVAASLLLIAGLVTVFSRQPAAAPSSHVALTALSSASGCATTSMGIKAYYSGSYLKPGTTSGSSVRYSDGGWDPAGAQVASTIPTWTITQDSTNRSEWSIKTSSHMYLRVSSSSSVTSGSYNALKVVSTASPDQYTKFVLTDASGSPSIGGYCTPNRYYIQPVQFPSYYLQGGTYSPRFARPGDLRWWLLETASDSEFVIESINTGQGPCGVASNGCIPVQSCKIGVSVLWTNYSLTPSASQREKIETAAQGACNSHCLTCNYWDLSCKPCGGTIDRGGSMVQGGPNYYRRCDCNSAYKAAQISFGSLLVLFLITMANTQVYG